MQSCDNQHMEYPGLLKIHGFIAFNKAAIA
jgi:hypothetical protein